MTDRDTAIFAIPWWLLILLAIAGAIWLFLGVRRKRDAANAQAWIEHMEAEVRRVAAEAQVLETAGALGNAGPSGTAESN